MQRSVVFEEALEAAGKNLVDEFYIESGEKVASLFEQTGIHEDSFLSIAENMHVVNPRYRRLNKAIDNDFSSG
ncbi:MAG: hypothetical protein ACREA4_00090 [Nitrososphaera sp.]